MRPGWLPARRSRGGSGAVRGRCRRRCRPRSERSRCRCRARRAGRRCVGTSGRGGRCSASAWWPAGRRAGRWRRVRTRPEQIDITRAPRPWALRMAATSASGGGSAGSRQPGSTIVPARHRRRSALDTCSITLTDLGSERTSIGADGLEAVPVESKLWRREADELGRDPVLENQEPVVSSGDDPLVVRAHEGRISSEHRRFCHLAEGSAWGTLLLTRPRRIDDDQLFRGGFPGDRASRRRVSRRDGTLSSLLRFETDCWSMSTRSSRPASPRSCSSTCAAPRPMTPGTLPAPVTCPTARSLRPQPGGLPAGTTFVVYCAGPHCNGADRAALRLARLGRPVKKMMGSIKGWKAEGFEFATS